MSVVVHQLTEEQYGGGKSNGSKLTVGEVNDWLDALVDIVKERFEMVMSESERGCVWEQSLEHAITSKGESGKKLKKHNGYVKLLEKNRHGIRPKNCPFGLFPCFYWCIAKIRRFCVVPPMKMRGVFPMKGVAVPWVPIVPGINILGREKSKMTLTPCLNLLLCAVPRNSEACRAIAALAAQQQSPEDRSLKTVLSPTQEELDVAQIEQKHKGEHRNIGVNVQLTLEELDRLSLVLQAPSGGPVEEPPIAIGEHVLKCLAVEEMEARQSSGARGTPASLHRLSLMHNGLVTVGDAERILRKYLEDELAAAQQELDENNDNPDDVSQKLSKLNLGNQPLSPPRSRGLSVADSVATETLNDSSYFKELSYRKLHSTTVLLEPNKDFGGFTSNNTTNTDTQSVVSLHSQTSSTHHQSIQHDKLQTDLNESGRLHDLHISDCSDTHLYLLQPFEHATIAACTDCTIVVGAVAAL